MNVGDFFNIDICVYVDPVMFYEGESLSKSLRNEITKVENEFFRIVGLINTYVTVIHLVF